MKTYKDNDATPERLIHAKSAELETEHPEFVSPEGKLLRRRQILCVLDTYEKRGMISSIQRDAGKMFLALVYQGTAKTRVTMAYQSGVDNGHAKFDLLDFIELKTDAALSARAAARSVFPGVRLALTWLVDSLSEERRIATLGAMYAGAQGRDAQTERGLTVMRFALDCLAHHFRMADLAPTLKETESWLRTLTQEP
jgi:hypothetical protein